MRRVPKKPVFVPIWKKCHKTICSIEIFRFLTFLLLSFKIPISASILPVFWAFPVLGPIITSLTIVREAIMMGPWTGNAQKTGKTRRKWVFFNSTMEIARNLKISMLQLAIAMAHLLYIPYQRKYNYNFGCTLLRVCVFNVCTILYRFDLKAIFQRCHMLLLSIDALEKCFKFYLILYIRKLWILPYEFPGPCRHRPGHTYIR